MNSTGLMNLKGQGENIEQYAKQLEDFQPANAVMNFATLDKGGLKGGSWGNIFREEDRKSRGLRRD